jgi:hypothetical protein
VICVTLLPPLLIYSGGQIQNGVKGRGYDIGIRDFGTGEAAATGPLEIFFTFYIWPHNFLFFRI